MVVKRYMKCNKCESYVNFYISEEKSIENVTVSCQCGKKYMCAAEKKYHSEWKEIIEGGNINV